jgi:hypothetical protein
MPMSHLYCRFATTTYSINPGSVPQQTRCMPWCITLYFVMRKAAFGEADAKSCPAPYGPRLPLRCGSPGFEHCDSPLQ